MHSRLVLQFYSANFRFARIRGCVLIIIPSSSQPSAAHVRPSICPSVCLSHILTVGSKYGPLRPDAALYRRPQSWHVEVTAVTTNFPKGCRPRRDSSTNGRRDRKTDRQRERERERWRVKESWVSSVTSRIAFTK